MGNEAMTFLSRLGALAAAFFFGTLGPVLAAPQDYLVDFQDPVTPVMERIKSSYDVLLWICVAITLLVLLLQPWVMFPYSETRHPNPSKSTHNVVRELACTVHPLMPLLAIVFPSFCLPFFPN